MDLINSFLNWILTYLPILGGLAGGASFIYTFIRRNKRMKLILPQEYSVIHNVTYLVQDYNPHIDEYENDVAYYCRVQSDICIINASDQEQVVHSIKLKNQDGTSTDLERTKFDSKLCFEEFESVI